MFPRSSCLVILALVASMLLSSTVAAQPPDNHMIVNPAAGLKFGPIPNAPACFAVAVERGDPVKGPSVMLARFAPGCVAPKHWHTPTETVMVASGALETQMQSDRPIVAHSGDFVYLPSHHVHRATCRSTAPCMVFLVSDGPFDVHWVNDAGQEISLEAAMKGKKSGSAAHVKKP